MAFCGSGGSCAVGEHLELSRQASRLACTSSAGKILKQPTHRSAVMT